MSIYLRNILRFVLLILIQVMLLNNVTLYWWAKNSSLPAYTPFIYPLILILLPLSTPLWAMMILGFLTGLTIDTFLDTGGIHAFVCVLISVLRTGILSAILPHRLSDYPNLSPGIKNLGWSSFLTFSAVVLLCHHFVYYLIEIWSLKSIGFLFLKTIVSFFTSMIFVILYCLFFGTKTGSNTLHD